jgi:hypothetical protein
MNQNFLFHDPVIIVDSAGADTGTRGLFIGMAVDKDDKPTGEAHITLTKRNGERSQGNVNIDLKFVRRANGKDKPQPQAGQWTQLDDGGVEVAGQRIEPGEYELRFKAADGVDATSFAGNAGVVVLDTKVTPELEREGLARDFIRMVQVARKDAGFNVSDRIAIEVKAGPAGAEAIEAHRDAVKAETLAVSLGISDAPAGTLSDGKLGDEPIAIGVRVAP